MYTQLGVLTKGTVVEVNVSELGMVTAGGKVVFGKYAQITNNPENDGCINAVLRMSPNCFYLFRVLLMTNLSRLMILYFSSKYISSPYARLRTCIGSSSYNSNFTDSDERYSTVLAYKTYLTRKHCTKFTRNYR